MIRSLMATDFGRWSPSSLSSLSAGGHGQRTNTARMTSAKQTPVGRCYRPASRWFS